VAEILDMVDHTGPGEDGWHVSYRVRRDDGEEIDADFICTGTARAVAEDVGDGETLAAIEDRGRAGGLKCAESAQSPAKRGRTRLSVKIDSVSGLLSHDYHYERDLPPV
jgi:hypothetical protein